MFLKLFFQNREKFKMDNERKSIITIDVTHIKTSKELHIILKKELDFPRFYGGNWDAFWDAITGLVELPITLQFVGWAELENNLRPDAIILKELLFKHNENFPSWKCEYLFN
jgi:RNAse (barnase) inhibitor barstar